MAPGELKPLFRLARRRPVSCVVVKTRDGRAALALDRLKKPRKLAAEMRGKANAQGLDAATLRYGRATVEGGSSGQVARIRVNKAPPSNTRQLLLAVLRPAGVQRCEFVVDAALEDEPEEGDDSRPEDEDRAEEDASEGSGGGSGGSAPISASLRARMTGLARRAADAVTAKPSGAGPILAAVGQANSALKAGDAAALGAAGDELDRLLCATPPVTPDQAAAPGQAAAADRYGQRGVSGGSTPLPPSIPPASDSPAASRPEAGAVIPDPARAAALRMVLTGLAQDAADGSASGTQRRRDLARLANEANAHLKHGDCDAAERSLGTLREALHPGTGPGGAGTGDPSNDGSDLDRLASANPMSAPDAPMDGAPGPAPSTPASASEPGAVMGGASARAGAQGPVLTPGTLQAPDALREMEQAQARVTGRGARIEALRREAEADPDPQRLEALEAEARGLEAENGLDTWRMTQGYLDRSGIVCLPDPASSLDALRGQPEGATAAQNLTPAQLLRMLEPFRAESLAQGTARMAQERVAAGQRTETEAAAEQAVGQAMMGAALGGGGRGGRSGGRRNRGGQSGDVPPPNWIPTDVQARVPSQWGNGAPSGKGESWRWNDPTNKGNGVRIDRGNPNNSQHIQQQDHVVVRSDGKIIGRDGKPISGPISDNPYDAHIPLEEYQRWTAWNHP